MQKRFHDADWPPRRIDITTMGDHECNAGPGQTYTVGASCDQCAGQCDAGKNCPREPIPTDYGDIEWGNRSTQGGALFAVALFLSIVAACLGLWLAGMQGWLK